MDVGRVASHGPLNETALDILCELGRRITACSGDDHEGFFSFERLSVCVQQFNVVLLHDSFSMDQPDFSYFCISAIFETPGTFSRVKDNNNNIITINAFISNMTMSCVSSMVDENKSEN